MTYLERLKAKLHENTLPDEPSRPSKGAFEPFEGSQGGHISQTERPPKYPLFYTDAQREAGRRDAERLGYGHSWIVS